MSPDVHRDPVASPTKTETQGEPSERASKSDTLEAAVERLSEVVDGLQRLIELRLARARVEFRERLFGAAGWIVLTVLILTLVVTGAIRVMLGLSLLMQGLFPGTPWIGEVITAFAGFALAAAVGVFARARVRSKNLKRLRKRFEPSEEET